MIVTLTENMSCRLACDLPVTYMLNSLEWSHFMVSLSKSFSPWAPLGGLKIGQASSRCLFRVYRANSMEEVVGFHTSCLQTVQSHPCNTVEAVA